MIKNSSIFSKFSLIKNKGWLFFYVKEIIENRNTLKLLILLIIYWLKFENEQNKEKREAKKILHICVARKIWSF